MRLKLKELRLKNGLTQQELAQKSGVRQSVISDIESGEVKNPRMDTLIAFAHVFNCKIDDMISPR